MAVNGMAPPVVTWEGLASFCQQMRIELEPWESETLVRLGRMRAEIIAEAWSSKQK